MISWEFGKNGKSKPRMSLWVYIVLNVVTTFFWFPLYYITEEIPIGTVFMYWLIITVASSICWWRIDEWEKKQ